MPFLSHAGLSLRYDRTGAGPAVLFIHGWNCNRTFWTRQVQALRDTHTVVAVDLRGHGESSRPRTGYTVGGMAADLEHLVRALGVPHVALVGWSLGGMIAIELARRLGDRVSALALVGTTPGGLADAKNPNAIDAKRIEEMRAAIKADARDFIRGFVPQVYKDGAASPLLAWTIGECQKTPPHVVEACFDGIAAFDARKHLKDIAVRTTVLHGRHDALLTLGGAEVLKKSIPKATMTIFENSGHAPHLEEPDKFNEALSKFLAP